MTPYVLDINNVIVLLKIILFVLQAQRPEIGIMQALESLNDTQVNEFLCGKAPLNLSMRLGDHMMLIQLQLSTVSGTSTPPPSGAPPPTRPLSLMQASRNLQHTLRRLSADVFSGRDEGKQMIKNSFIVVTLLSFHHNILNDHIILYMKKRLNVFQRWK